MNKDELILRTEALIDNPDARVPICLVLDVSGSMSVIVSGDVQQTGKSGVVDGEEVNFVTGENLVTRMDELNSGLEQFFTELLDDPNARSAAEVCVVGFAEDANIVRDFCPLDDSHKSLKLEVSNQNQTKLGLGVDKALELLDKRKEEYKSVGVDYFQPWLVVITDGIPTDESHLVTAKEIEKRVTARKLTVFPIAVGDLKDLSELSKISPNRRPLKLKGTKFKEFFQWLSKSVSRTSASIPGEKVPLDKDGIDDWGEL